MANNIFITEVDSYLFGNGTHYEIYNKMGAHPTTVDGKTGVYFAVWAPKAREVYVVGEFNGWNEYEYPMKRISEGGIYELFIPGVREGQLYKYMIISAMGEKLYKADPYANASELRPGNASKIVDIEGYKWGDEKWIAKEETTNHLQENMCIYE